MPEMTLLAAINDALNIAMAKDERVVMLGEDIGKKGGVFGATAGLYEKYGDLRVMDTPLSENGISAPPSAWRSTG
jgi:pyruvate dehydrogenase E1 component beta subunit